MSDAGILKMLNRRDERAIYEMDAEYGPLLKKIIRQIIATPEDAEECLNDTYLHMWNSIPPASPKNLRAYLCKAARNLALDRCKYQSRKKRQTPNAEKIAADMGININTVKTILSRTRHSLKNHLDREGLTL